jgi:hypothetical protein
VNSIAVNEEGNEVITLSVPVTVDGEYTQKLKVRFIREISASH